MSYREEPEEGNEYDPSQPMDEEELMADVAELLTTANAPPWYIYAFKKTGFMLTSFNRADMSAEDLKRWDDAVAEYEQKAKKKSKP